MFSPMIRKTDRVLSIPLTLIVPNPQQPRRYFDKDTIQTLSQSILKYGIISPLTVRRGIGGSYELVAGERRLRAAEIAGLTAVPCIVSEMDEEQSAVVALIENLQRQDLNFFEEALGIERLIHTYHLTQEEAAERLSKNQSTIANKLRLLRLSEDIRSKMIEHNLTERHARALIRLTDEKHQNTVLKKVIERNLNVADTEKLIETMIENKKRPMHKIIVRDVRIFVNTINNALSVMKQAGISAQSFKVETDEFIEYKITIPKY